MPLLTIPSRRSFIAGLVSALAAPAIVHAGNLMPIKLIPSDDWSLSYWFGYGENWYWKTISIRTGLDSVVTKMVPFAQIPSDVLLEIGNVPVSDSEFPVAIIGGKVRRLRAESNSARWVPPHVSNSYGGISNGQVLQNQSARSRER